MNIKEKESHWNERVSWGSIAMASSGWAIRRMNSLLESGMQWEEAYSILTNECKLESQQLSNKVVSIIQETLEKLSVDDNKKKEVINILEVGTGLGDLTVNLLLELPENYNVFSIDCSDQMIKHTHLRAKSLGVKSKKLKRIKKGLATEIDKHENKSFDIIIWGKLGHHLVQEFEDGKSEWELALEKVKWVLKEGGNFLLYEPMQDLNPAYKVKPKQKKWTHFRTLEEYQTHLYPLYLVENISFNYCEEIYSITLWQKPKEPKY